MKKERKLFQASEIMPLSGDALATVTGGCDGTGGCTNFTCTSMNSRSECGTEIGAITPSPPGLGTRPPRP